MKKDELKKSRVIVIGFVTEHLVTVGRELAKQDIEIVFWLGGKNYFKNTSRDKDLFSHTIFQDGLDLLAGKSSIFIDTLDFPALSGELIEKMRSIESQMIVMMNNVDFENVAVSQKLHLYYTYLKYWYGVLTSLKPDAVLFHDIPHSSQTYVLFSLAKHLGIQTIMHTSLRDIPDRVIFFDDFRTYTRLQEEYKRFEHSAVSLSDLSEDMQAYYRSHTESQKNDVAPAYSRKDFMKRYEDAMRLTPRFSSVVKHFLDGTFFKSTYYYVRELFHKRQWVDIGGHEYYGWQLKIKYVKWRRLRNAYRMEYQALQKVPDYKEPFVYIPLHVQPERSTAAEGDMFVDQILMVDMVSEALPKGWKIYLKEQESQWLLPRMHMGRYKGYYRQVSLIPNVIIVPAETSSFTLIKRSRAVATVTGTAAWQGILRGKPALLFGHIWYEYCKGSFYIRNVGECKKALKGIEEGAVPREEDTLRFLKALEDVSVRSHYRRGFNAQAPLSEEENVHNIVEGYKKALQHRE